MSFDTEEELFRDALFRQRRKHGVYRLIDAPVLEGTVADTHCHTHMLPDPALAFARCAVNGVDFVCNIVDTVEDDPATRENVRGWLAAAPATLLEIAPECTASLPQLCFAAGCHPHNAKGFDAAAMAYLRQVLADPQVKAIGEIGLDFHYDLSPRDVQEEVFRQQIRLAHELNMPVALHIREAHDLALQVLEEEGFPQAGTLLHCFNLGPEDIDPWLAHDCYIGLGGPVTFKKSDFTREAAKKVPLNRLVTETDAPYMTPEPMRGITCWTDHVIFTADALARVRGCETPEERRQFFAALHENALRFYGCA
ncbi:MAG: TatD family hydrolase [Eggerthellales bacterium]|nr:TatD family hydrolase [Eggerthellales bacterium]